MMGALGNTDQFGFRWQRQQHYVGSVFSDSISKPWTVQVEPAFGLSDVSDPFVPREPLFDGPVNRERVFFGPRRHNRSETGYQ